MNGVRAVDVAILVPVLLGSVWMGRVALAGGRREKALWIALLFQTAAIAAGVPAVRRCIDGLLAVASVTNLIVHLLTLGAASCLIEFVHQTTSDGRRLSAPVRGLAVAGPLLVAVFAAMPRPDGEKDLLTEATTGWSLAYWGIVMLYLGWGLALSASMCLRYGRQAAPGSLRTSLRLLGAGSICGLLYVTHRVAYLVVHTIVPGWFDNAAVVATTQVLMACTLPLLIFGVAWPSLAERARVRRVRRRLKRLRPLWLALREVAPEVMLPLPAALERDPDVLLYRHVIEIRDGALAVRAACEDARAALVTAGLSGPALEAATQAVALRRAVREPGPSAAPGVPTARSGPPSVDGGLDAEVTWLEQVAAAYRTPLVRRTAEALAAAGPKET